MPGQIGIIRASLDIPFARERSRDCPKMHFPKMHLAFGMISVPV
jgi:hypothetical protein